MSTKQISGKHFLLKIIPPTSKINFNTLVTKNKKLVMFTYITFLGPNNRDPAQFINCKEFNSLNVLVTIGSDKLIYNLVVNSPEPAILKLWLES